MKLASFQLIGFQKANRDKSFLSWLTFCIREGNITEQFDKFQNTVKDTHREKVLSNKTSTLMKSMNMHIWVVGTSNQLFLRGS